MHRILPVDGSSSADHALNHIIAILKIRGDAEVNLLHVNRALLPGSDGYCQPKRRM